MIYSFQFLNFFIFLFSILTIDNFLSKNLLFVRPTMADISLGHESYFSRSLPGSKLARHLDERHEETKGDNISLISNMYMRIITKIV